MTNQPRVTDASLDRAIDDVARQMTALEPAADLRARIMSRIEERPERTPRSWAIRLLPLAAGVAAVAVTAIALRAPRPAGAPGAPVVPSVTEPPAPPIESARVVEAISEPGTNPAAPAPRSTATKSAPAAEPSDDELAWLERAVPALAQPEALTVEGIQPETLTIAHIELKPLVPGPLSPAPPDGGGGKR